MHVTCTFQGRRKTSSPQKNQNRNQAGLGRNEADSITSLPPTDWKSSTCSKGAFYFEGDSLISHQYNLELQQRQRVQISIQVRIQSMDLRSLVKQLSNNFYMYVHVHHEFRNSFTQCCSTFQSLDENVDCQLFIFKVNCDSAINKNSESRYLLVERTPMNIPSGETSQVSGITKSKAAAVSWTGHLDKGVYLLIPSTTGCTLRKRKSQPSPEVL